MLAFMFHAKSEDVIIMTFSRMRTISTHHQFQSMENHQTIKSEPLNILETLHETSYAKPVCSEIILKGSVLINTIIPKSSKSFLNTTVKNFTRSFPAIFAMIK